MMKTSGDTFVVKYTERGMTSFLITSSFKIQTRGTCTTPSPLLTQLKDITSEMEVAVGEWFSKVLVFQVFPE